ncbi:methyl-CpG-binding domain-containing protein 4-like [Magnolia sinica]|uniref:methyl-CpG-binding domain-containing protein 4-like n=1 Tax=Magnolia sinica TaxID=86752 RepID=UPI00265A80A8|nr:methyl-CpG-binding domain-containing protein 4-like [Magnolia sinica]
MKKSAKAHQTSQNTVVGAYAVQCGECFKWRLIPSQERYEEIRATFIEDPFFCDMKEGISCDDPADVEYDTSRIWIIDKPNIPKPPDGFERGLTLRKDNSRMDAHYATPIGKKVRAPAEVEKFLAMHPQYKKANVSVSSFNFTVPKIMEDTLPRKTGGKDSASASKKMKA